MRSVRPLALAQSITRRRAALSSSEEVRYMCFRCMDDQRISYCGYQFSAPCDGGVCCRSVYCDASLSQIGFKLMFTGVLRLSGAPPSASCWPRDTSFGMGRIPPRFMCWAAPSSGFGRVSASWVVQGGDGREG